MKKIQVDEQKMLKLYKNNFTKKQISQIFGISISTLVRKLRMLCVEKKPTGCQRRYNVNHNYFDNIDSEDKAYWLGFILADGCIRNNSRVLTFNLSEKDRTHLQLFLKFTNATYEIKTAKKKVCSLSITSKIMTNRLQQLGIIANKKLPLIGLPNGLLRHYWRGVIDGDGTIGQKIHKRKNGSIKLQPLLGLVGNLATCVAFKQFCLSITNTKAEANPAENKNAYRFRLHGPKAKLVIERLYSDATVGLARKIRRANAILD